MSKCYNSGRSWKYNNFNIAVFLKLFYKSVRTQFLALNMVDVTLYELYLQTFETMVFLKIILMNKIAI